MCLGRGVSRRDSGGLDATAVEAALCRTFAAMDFEILAGAAATGARCGTTACVVLQLGPHLYCAHAGAPNPACFRHPEFACWQEWQRIRSVRCSHLAALPVWTASWASTRTVPALVRWTHICPRRASVLLL